MSENYKNLTEDNFEDFVGATSVCIVDFWASWCGPCKMLAPVIEEVAADYKDKIAVGKVNVDDEPALAEKFGILSIPAVYIFKNGQVAEKLIGFRQKQQIAASVDKYL